MRGAHQIGTFRDRVVAPVSGRGRHDFDSTGSDVLEFSTSASNRFDGSSYVSKSKMCAIESKRQVNNSEEPALRTLELAQCSSRTSCCSLSHKKSQWNVAYEVGCPRASVYAFRQNVATVSVSLAQRCQLTPADQVPGQKPRGGRASRPSRLGQHGRRFYKGQMGQSTLLYPERWTRRLLGGLRRLSSF
jgi:hypothetical protein